MRYLLTLILFSIALVPQTNYANQRGEKPNNNDSSEKEYTLRAYWGESIPAKISAYEDQIQERCNDGEHMECLLIRAASFRDLYKDMPYEKALTVLAADCEDGNAERCIDLSILYGYEEYVEADKVKARRYSEKACDSGNFDGCFVLATMLSSRILESESESEGLDLFKKTCARKHAESCMAVAEILSYDFDRRNEQLNAKKVKDVYKYREQACDYGSAYACYVVAKSYLAEETQPIKKDVDRAVKYLDRACRAEEARACSHLVYLYDDGKDVVKNPTKELKYGLLGCELDDAYSCSSVSYQYQFASGVERNMEQSLKFSEKACSLGVLHECVSLGEFYRDGEYVDQSADRAVEYFTLGCEGNESDSCNDIRDYIYLVSNNMPLDDTANLPIAKEVSSELVKKIICVVSNEYGECDRVFEEGERALSGKLYFSVQGDEFISINPETLRVATLMINGVDSRKDQEKATNFSIEGTNHSYSYGGYDSADEDESLDMILSVAEGFTSMNDSIELEGSVIANTSAKVEAVVSEPFDPTDFHSFKLGPITFQGMEFRDTRYSIEYVAKDIEHVTKNEIDILEQLITPEIAERELISPRHLDSVIEEQNLSEKEKALVSELFYQYVRLDQRSRYQQSSVDEDGDFYLRVGKGSRQIKKVILLDGDTEVGVSEHRAFLRMDEDESSGHHFESPIPKRVRVKVVYWKDPKNVKIKFSLKP